MSNAILPPPSVDQIRQMLVERARLFVARHRTSFSAIGVAAVNDSKFLRRVERGEGFSVTTYQRVLDWMDAADIALASHASDDNEYGAPAAGGHVNESGTPLRAEAGR